ncbi:PAS domain S-box protein [Candidatus Gracilibacteria bacterium]|nr:PAS domain S-box protein [Candidatus Gracilibacteria bacterium]
MKLLNYLYKNPKDLVKFISKNKTGKEEIILTVLINTTERKKIELDLQKSEENYRSLVNNVNIGVYRSSGGAKGKFIEANPAIAKILGYKSIDEVKKISLSKDLFHKNSGGRKKFLKKLREQGFVKNEEVIFKKKNGNPIICSITATSHYNDKGGIDWIDGVLEDITEQKKSEEALKNSQRKLFHIIDFYPDATIVIDKEGKIIAWNKAIEKMTGCSARNMIGKGNHEYALPFFNRRIPILIDIALQFDNKKKDNFEERYLDIKFSKDCLEGITENAFLKGKKVFLYGRASPLRDENGKIIGAIESIRDITDAKLADEKLKESEERSKVLLSNLPDCIFIHNKGIITYGNKAMMEVMACDEKELIGTHVNNYILEEYKELVKENIKKRYMGIPVDDYEIKIRNKNGKIFTVIVRAEVIYQNQEMNILTVLIDITERNDMEKELIDLNKNLEKKVEEKINEIEINKYESLNAYKNFVEDMSEAVIIIDSNQKIVYINKKTAEITGYLLEEIINNSVYSFCDKKDISSIQQSVGKIISQGSYSLYVGKIISKNGKKIPVQITGMRFIHGMIIAIIQDLTELKEYENRAKYLEELNRTKDDFLNIASHELRTPMTSIKGYLSMIKEGDYGKIDDTLKNPIDIMYKSADRLIKLVNDMLDISKLESGNMTFNNVIFSLKDFFEGIYAENFAYAKEKNLNFILDMPNDDIKINSDIDKFKQIITNLIGNAFKFTLENGNVVIKWYLIDKNNVRIEIIDSGIGINKANFERIFTKFGQEGNTLNREYGGTGLGLPISRELIKKLGGDDLYLESELNKGSKFYFNFPIVF